MKKSIIIMAASVILLSSCGTYTGAGAGCGAYYGGWIGSAIGGLTGGHRGHDIGTLIGMAGGAAVGAAIANAAEEKRQDDMYKYRAEKARLAENRKARQNDRANTATMLPEGYNYEMGALEDSGFDSSNSGDDRIDIDFGDDASSIPTVSADDLTTPVGGAPSIEIRNARFVDGNGDGVISRGESSVVVFEIYNSGTASAYNIQPTVIETTGNKHLFVSPSVLIESLGAGKGVRYTARVVADKYLKNNPAQFNIAVVQGNQTVSKVMNFTVPCRK